MVDDGPAGAAAAAGPSGGAAGPGGGAEPQPAEDPPLPLWFRKESFFDAAFDGDAYLEDLRRYVRALGLAGAAAAGRGTDWKNTRCRPTR